MVHEGCFLDKGWKLGSIDSLLKRIRKTGIQLSGNQEAVDRVRRGAVDDLVLSQEGNPKRHQSAREIVHETAILRSSVHRIIHRDLQLKCFKRCRVLLQGRRKLSGRYGGRHTNPER